MTSEEKLKKAYELCNKFYEGSVFDYEFIEGNLEEKERAKERALICVDEKFKSIEDSFGGNTAATIKLMKLSKAYKELIEVKREIYKL